MTVSTSKKPQKKIWDDSMTADQLAALIHDEDFVREIEQSPFFQEKYRRAVELVQKIDWSTFPFDDKKENAPAQPANK